MPWWWWALAALLLLVLTNGPMSEWMLRRLLTTRDVTPALRADLIWFFTSSLISRLWFRWFARWKPEEGERPQEPL